MQIGCGRQAGVKPGYPHPNTRKNKQRACWGPRPQLRTLLCCSLHYPPAGNRIQIRTGILRLGGERSDPLSYAAAGSPVRIRTSIARSVAGCPDPVERIPFIDCWCGMPDSNLLRLA